MSNQLPTTILDLQVKDIRFPTSLEFDGSDAVHSDPDYSCAYVVLTTDVKNVTGCGFSFTIGRGTQIVVEAILAYRQFVVGQKIYDIYNSFGQFWRRLTNESQLRWLGPEKGVVHLAVGAIVNALWDLWAKIENKPLWKLLVDMEPSKLISTLDFTYMTDAITPTEALEILEKGKPFKAQREKELLELGYPAYTTHAGWMGYSTDKVKQRCKQLIEHGFTGFKVKVGVNIDDDKRRLAAVRETIGWDKTLMVDANQAWDVPVAIDWMKQLAHYRPLWIEEPTSSDDIAGHATIAKELAPLGIGVATGEHCANRVMFKQFLQSGGMKFCQIDACRIGGVNEVLLVILLAAKLKIWVCPHAGGVGLCELVQHLMMFDYISVTGTSQNRVIEYVDHLHEHFKNPVIIKNGNYQVPTAAGYSSEMLPQAIADYSYPDGNKWLQLFAEGKFVRP
ncbi:Mitochondrial enolase super member 1 [Chamberlinius hualienensis]